ncbi:nucleoside diphosphate kinase [Pelagophyceae sp. CCMP2097]|nr:nucleoside diphosphate kinase [Pelagophyceae sp. CCMP2097]
MVGPDVQNCAARLDAGECTLCLIKPHVVKDKLAGSMLECIFAAGFSIEGAQQMTLDADMAHQFYGAYKGVLARYEDIVGELAGGPLLALRISGPVAAFREFCGPTDVKLATALRPKSLRATFGKGVVHNAVHATDLDDDGAFECDFFFNVLSGGVA